jgi:hypothetical protein
MVDFIVIGAQKSGTTSLFRYLRAHPQIYMPTAKELEFFSNDRRYAKGLDWYAHQYFASASNGALCGEASTHYMMYPKTPERIRVFLPEVKLIALLRNPIDRAYSHYRMSVERGRETRSFAEMVAESLGKPAFTEPVDENFDYLSFGQYGAILGRYLECFDRERIAVFFTDDMVRAPRRFIAEVYSFLGVNAGFLPDNIGRKYNVGGSKIVPGLDQRVRMVLRWFWRRGWFRRAVGRTNYEAMIFWTFTNFNVRRSDDPGPSLDMRRMLARRYYADDVARLASDFRVKPPWNDFRQPR